MRTHWVFVAKAGEIEPGKPRFILFQRREVGVFHEGGRYFAVLNYCPHMGAPVCRGQVIRPVTGTEAGGPQARDADTPVLRCPWHRWEFRLEDGLPLAPLKTKLRTFPVRVNEGRIEVELPGGESAGSGNG
jgi:nitrite reductase (NADH) small subunit